MKKLRLVTLFAILCCSAVAYSKTDIYGRRHYFIALHINTPTSLMYKYGGGIEYRFRGVAILNTYDKYMGAYPGRQLASELEFYLHTHKRHQSYIYVKGLAGDAGYDGSKITFFGYPTDLKVADAAYIGGGAGYGRRWNFNVFFVTFTAGLKYCLLEPDLTTQEKNLYTLFYNTGPGSYIDVHFQFGIQL